MSRACFGSAGGAPGSTAPSAAAQRGEVVPRRRRWRAAGTCSSDGPSRSAAAASAARNGCAHRGHGGAGEPEAGRKGHPVRTVQVDPALGVTGHLLVVAQHPVAAVVDDEHGDRQLLLHQGGELADRERDAAVAGHDQRATPRPGGRADRRRQGVAEGPPADRVLQPAAARLRGVAPDPVAGDRHVADDVPTGGPARARPSPSSSAASAVRGSAATLGADVVPHPEHLVGPRLARRDPGGERVADEGGVADDDTVRRPALVGGALVDVDAQQQRGSRHRPVPRGHPVELAAHDEQEVGRGDRASATSGSCGGASTSSGWSTPSRPRAAYVVTTGAPSRQARSVTACSAPAATHPPPAQITTRGGAAEQGRRLPRRRAGREPYGPGARRADPARRRHRGRPTGTPR